jgi:hypothetical protein
MIEYAGSRNHLKIRGLSEVVRRMREVKGKFPKHRGWLPRVMWWTEVVEFEATEEERNLIMKALCDNSAMEDAKRPAHAIYTLEIQGGRYPR